MSTGTSAAGCEPVPHPVFLLSWFFRVCLVVQGNISIQQVGAVSYPAVREGRALQTVETIEPYKIGIVYNAPIHESARYLGCAAGSACNPARCPGLLTFGPCCDCIQFNSKLRPRMYAQVHENRVEVNYPFTWCCGAFVCDNTRVEYFDKQADSVKTETCCTPFHCCCCIECCGGVVAMAPMNCCNACYCACFRSDNDAAQYMRGTSCSTRNQSSSTVGGYEAQHNCSQPPVFLHSYRLTLWVLFAVCLQNVLPWFAGCER